MATAGETNYSLVCSIQKKTNGLINEPTASWNFTQEIDGVTINNIFSEKSVLTFEPLRLSHAGKYTCHGQLSLPAYPRNLSIQKHLSVVVQSKLLKIILKKFIEI